MKRSAVLENYDRTTDRMADRIIGKLSNVCERPKNGVKENILFIDLNAF